MTVIADRTGAELPYEVKTEFNIDKSLQHPNIYYFLLDGTVGFGSLEKYFNYDTSNIERALNDRGFVINKDAWLGAGYTNDALLCLMSPQLYDSLLTPYYSNTYDTVIYERGQKINVDFNKLGIDINDIFAINSNTEITNAFLQAKYNEATISWPPIMLNKDKYYNLEAADFPVLIGKADISVNLYNFTDLLTQSSILSIAREPILLCANTLTYKPEDYKLPQYEDIVNEIMDPNTYSPEDRGAWEQLYIRFIADIILTVDSPKFVFIHDMIAHSPFYCDENGIALEPDLLPDHWWGDVTKYLPQYKYSEKVMVKLVDLVLRHDPDAIIVLQADHGIHYDGHFWEGTDYTVKEINDMSFNVFSAVRVPEKYGILAEPLEPLNITRWLVNNYVGQNYEYVPKERSERPQ
jgi:hypothetical protein